MRFPRPLRNITRPISLSMGTGLTLKTLITDGEGYSVSGGTITIQKGGYVILENPSKVYLIDFHAEVNPDAEGHYDRNVSAFWFSITPPCCARGNIRKVGENDFPYGGKLHLEGYTHVQDARENLLKWYDCDCSQVPRGAGPSPGETKGPMGMWSFPLLNMLKGR